MLRPDNSARWASTKARTQWGSRAAWERRAQPMALRKKNSLEGMWGRMAALRKSTSRFLR